MTTMMTFTDATGFYIVLGFIPLGIASVVLVFAAISLWIVGLKIGRKK